MTLSNLFVFLGLALAGAFALLMVWCFVAGFILECNSWKERGLVVLCLAIMAVALYVPWGGVRLHRDLGELSRQDSCFTFALFPALIEGNRRQLERAIMLEKTARRFLSAQPGSAASWTSTAFILFSAAVVLNCASCAADQMIKGAVVSTTLESTSFRRRSNLVGDSDSTSVLLVKAE